MSKNSIELEWDASEEEREEHHTEEETVVTKRRQDALALLIHETKQSIQIKETGDTVVRAHCERMKELKVESIILKEDISHQMEQNEIYKTKLTADEKQMVQLKNQLVNTKEIIHTLKDVVNDLEERSQILKTGQVITQQLNEKCEDFLAMKKKYSDIIKEKQENIKSIREKAMEYKAEIEGENEYVRENKALKMEIDKLKITVNDQKKKRSELTQKYESISISFNEACKARQEKLNKESLLLSELEKVTQLQKESDAMYEAALEKADTEKKNKIEILEKLNQKMQEAKYDLQQADKSISDKESRLSELKNEFEYIKRTHEDLVKHVEDENNRFTSKIQERKQDLAGKEKILSQVECELKAERQKEVDIRRNIDAKRNMLLDLANRKLETMSKIIELQDLLKESEKSKLIEQHTESLNLDKLQHCKSVREEAVLSLKAAKNRIEADQKKFDGELELKRIQSLQLQKEKQALIEENEKKYNYLNASYEYMIVKKNDLENQMNKSNTDLNLKKEEVARMTKLIEEKENKLNQLKKTYQETKKQEASISASQTQWQVVTQETEIEKPVSILKSPKRPNTPTKRVSFTGIPSFESSDYSEDIGGDNAAITFDDIIKEMKSAEKTSPKQKKRKFSQ